MLGYGLSYLGYFLRPRYFDWVVSLGLDAGYEHAAMYLGHTVLLLFFSPCLRYLYRRLQKKSNPEDSYKENG